MVENPRKNMGAAEANPRETQCPAGYLQGADGKYRIDPRYIDADRTTREMPVRPDFTIIRNGNLLDAPRAVVHSLTAQSPSRLSQPKLTDLESENYYNRNFMQAHAGRSAFNYPQEQITSPVEIRPHAGGLIDDPAIDVQYTFGVQSVQIGGTGVDIKGIHAPRFFHGHKLNAYDFADSDDFNGLAYVAHVRVPVVMPIEFPTPFDLKYFNGVIPFSSHCARTRRVREMFHGMFQTRLEDIGEQVSEIRGESVTGVLLSPITPHFRIEETDGIKSMNPDGELVMAASYLV